MKDFFRGKRMLITGGAQRVGAAVGRCDDEVLGTVEDVQFLALKLLGGDAPDKGGLRFVIGLHRLRGDTDAAVRLKDDLGADRAHGEGVRQCG